MLGLIRQFHEKEKSKTVQLCEAQNVACLTISFRQKHITIMWLLFQELKERLDFEHQYITVTSPIDALILRHFVESACSYQEFDGGLIFYLSAISKQTGPVHVSLAHEQAVRGIQLPSTKRGELWVLLPPKFSYLHVVQRCQMGKVKAIGQAN